MEQLAELNELMLTDHYEFKQVLGKGSFGLVVSAYNDKLEAVVAIKVLSLV
jgi:calcium/calmodulin-dependent protein kinase I